MLGAGCGYINFLYSACSLIIKNSYFKNNTSILGGAINMQHVSGTVNLVKNIFYENVVSRNKNDMDFEPAGGAVSCYCFRLSILNMFENYFYGNIADRGEPIINFNNLFF